eukprot:GHVS01079135.1.p1 GENE.GHVS01079135.1~~GHVS01079135.1.p1  ORF type:complete len:158 (+),score=21.04 GHVS01079135.1:124-597(+)
MAIAAICFVGKQNEPLSFRVFNNDELQLLFGTYAALDVVEERSLQQQSVTGVYSSDSYLGYVCPALCGEYRLFAYITSTGLKIILTLTDTDTYNDQDIKILFRQLHKLYADELCNPFLQETIHTPSFVRKLDAVMSKASKVLADTASQHNNNNSTTN